MQHEYLYLETLLTELGAMDPESVAGSAVGRLSSALQSIDSRPVNPLTEEPEDITAYGTGELQRLVQIRQVLFGDGATPGLFETLQKRVG